LANLPTTYGLDNYWDEMAEDTCDIYAIKKGQKWNDLNADGIWDMGEPVRILDLAEDLIRLSGLEPGKDIEIVFTGIRPGEKLSEDLWDQGFAYLPTAHPDINRVDSEEVLSADDLETLVEKLIALARAGKPEEIINLLSETIPGASITMHEPELDMVE